MNNVTVSNDNVDGKIITLVRIPVIGWNSTKAKVTSIFRGRKYYFIRNKLPNAFTSVFRRAFTMEKRAGGGGERWNEKK